MDIPRETSKRKRFFRRALFVLLVLGSVVGTTAALSRLEPAAPTVDIATLYLSTVKRGEMVREVKGMGNLVPVDIRWVSPDTTGRVEKILIQPGASVTKDTVILELSSPELELAVEEAKLNVKSAESQYTFEEVQIKRALLDLQASMASRNANYITAKLRSEPNEELYKRGALAAIQVKTDKIEVEQLLRLKELEEERFNTQSELAKTQLAAAQAQVDQARAQYELKKKQFSWLKVRAGIEGVLEQLLAEVGQQVGPGTSLAKVTDPKRLKAVLRIDQNQAREVKIGQRAEIDLRSSILRGHVSRIDPAVLEGTVNVDVVLDDPLPEGARSDQNLTGTIEIEKLVDTLYVGRPVYSQAGGAITLFKLDADREAASRVRVALGRSSVSTVEVIEGLNEGDQVILSDMNQWDDVDRIRLR